MIALKITNFYNAGIFDIYLDEVHEIPELCGVIGWEKI